MIDNNTKKVNELLSKAFAFCSIVIILLLLTKVVGIFNFSLTIILILLIVGIPATLGPVVLFKIGVPDTFLKYYMLIMMSALIGCLGMNNGIGIYITYVLVPICSCLYFNKKYTIHIGIISYITMAIGVYFNCANKLEVQYKGWSHAITFRNYIIGFTFEYVVVMIFVLLLVSRAEMFMAFHQDSLRLQKKENERQKQITSFYKGSLGSQRTTVFDSIKDDMDQFSSEDFVKMAAGHRFTSTIQEMLKSSSNEDDTMNNVLNSVADYFGLYRILYIEPDPVDYKLNKLSYSWARKEKYKLNTFYEEFNEDDYKVISQAYDRMGYIQLMPDGEEGEKMMAEIDCGLTRYIRTLTIGTQLWFPTLHGGNYSGAMCFERIGSSRFTPVDILLLSDVVAAISLFVMSNNANHANMAKSTFLSSMSHEIRTPLNAIIGMTDVALREDMTPTVRKSLNIIKSSSEGLLAIINDILDFSKIEAGHVEIIPDDYETLALINDITTIANARNVEKKLPLTFHVPEDLPKKLHGDMVRIKQVCVNLATNAIKYTDEGSVDVYFTCEPLEGKENQVLFKYKVSDTGQGIKESDIGKLFNSFSQVDQRRNHHKEGTGLGLAISKQLVELMGGSIGVNSTYGEGSEFFFEIPQIISDTSTAGSLENFDYSEEVTTKEVQFTAPNANILIVDDNEINRIVAESLFSVFEMNMTLAEGGMEALELTKANKYDLIFMDHFMPDLDGVETTKRIRSDSSNPNQNSTIIALTADAVDGARDEMINAGMDDFLTKPIDLNLATAILKKYLE